MKKLSLLFVMCLLAFSSFSQVRIGLRLSPGICLNKVNDLKSSDGYEYDNDGSGVRLTFGPSFDFHISDNAAFSVGAWYTSSRAGLKASYDFLGPQTYTETVSLQTVQVPITFKVFTNEIATDMKLYFQLGGVANFITYEKFLKSDPDIDKEDYQNKYNAFDVSAYLGAGVIYKLGETNELFGGLYYNRGLTNLLSSKENDANGVKFNDGAKYTLSQVGLEVGVRF